MDDLSGIAKHFRPQGSITDIREFGNGNINSTFLVTIANEIERHFILQRINTQVFRRPELVMGNMRIATGHARRRLASVSEGRRWEVPRVLLSQDGQDHWRGPGGSFWRAVSFIEGARSFDTIQNNDHAREAGHALGMFHALLSTLPADRLADTLEGFHITPVYLRHYDEVLAGHKADNSPEVDYCMRFISERRDWAHVLEKAKAEGKLLLRPIHGDPKINNILMDSVTGQAISIVDLDTIKPGLVHYDIGDCLRSGCNPIGEETEQWETVRFDTDLCQSILHGYLSRAKAFLTPKDFYYLYYSARLIAFELGLRFFTDYMEGDVYFKVKRPGHNLLRALVQFRLTESIESQEAAIRSIIEEKR